MTLLSVRGLGKSFGGVKAVDGIDFDVAAGELLALIGPNGAGKSTTFNMVNGQLRADRGSVKLDGHELVGRKPREIWALGVARTFQIAETFSSMTVLENVQMALISHAGRLFSLWTRARCARVFVVHCVSLTWSFPKKTATASTTTLTLFSLSLY